ncbi:MAG: hypothetical protein JO102_04820, partial [Elusimicrobia bacterium]|nr:hypothetical protein [Elusimicrobiota bacterium]
MSRRHTIFARKAIAVLLVKVMFLTQILFNPALVQQAFAKGTGVVAESGMSFWQSRARAAQNLRAADPAATLERLKKTVQDQPADPQRLPILNPVLEQASRTLHIHDVHVGQANEPVVMVLQDVHMNAEAQTAIGQGLAAINQKPDDLLVGVEAAAGPFDFAPYKQSPDPKLTQHLADYLLRENRISAVSWFGLTTEKAPAVVGIDDAALYRANVDAYKTAQRLQEKELGEIRRATAALNEKANSLSPDSKKLLNRLTAYHAGQKPITEHVKYLTGLVPVAGYPNLQLLAQAVSIEESLDNDRLKVERDQIIRRLAGAGEKVTSQILSLSLAQQAGRLSPVEFYGRLAGIMKDNGLPLSAYPRFETYVHYLRLADEIQQDKLFDELSAMNRAAVAAVVNSPEQRELFDAIEFAGLAEKLVKFQLTPEDWRDYQRLSPAAWCLVPGANVIDSGRRDPGASNDVARAKGRLAAFEAFYATAEKRNEAMMLNLLETMARNQRSTAVVVAGGFHTPGLVAMLEKRGASVVTMAPRFDAKGGGSEYLNTFLRERTPLAKLFAGEKLTLALANRNLGAMPFDPINSPAAVGGHDLTLLKAGAAAADGVITPAEKADVAAASLGLATLEKAEGTTAVVSVGNRVVNVGPNVAADADHQFRDVDELGTLGWNDAPRWSLPRILAGATAVVLAVVAVAALAVMAASGKHGLMAVVMLPMLGVMLHGNLISDFFNSLLGDQPANLRRGLGYLRRAPRAVVQPFLNSALAAANDQLSQGAAPILARFDAYMEEHSVPAADRAPARAELQALLDQYLPSYVRFHESNGVPYLYGAVGEDAIVIRLTYGHPAGATDPLNDRLTALVGAGSAAVVSQDHAPASLAGLGTVYRLSMASFRTAAGLSPTEGPRVDVASRRVIPSGIALTATIRYAGLVFSALGIVIAATSGAWTLAALATVVGIVFIRFEKSFSWWGRVAGRAIAAAGVVGLAIAFAPVAPVILVFGAVWLLTEIPSWVRDFRDQRMADDILFFVREQATSNGVQPRQLLLSILTNPRAAVDANLLAQNFRASLPKYAGEAELNPSSIGQWERFNRVVAKISWELTENRRGEWYQALPALGGQRPYPFERVEKGSRALVIVPFVPGLGRAEEDGLKDLLASVDGKDILVGQDDAYRLASGLQSRELREKLGRARELGDFPASLHANSGVLVWRNFRDLAFYWILFKTRLHVPLARLFTFRTLRYLFPSTYDHLRFAQGLRSRVDVSPELALGPALRRSIGLSTYRAALRVREANKNTAPVRYLLVPLSEYRETVAFARNTGMADDVIATGSAFAPSLDRLERQAAADVVGRQISDQGVRQAAVGAVLNRLPDSPLTREVVRVFSDDELAEFVRRTLDFRGQNVDDALIKLFDEIASPDDLLARLEAADLLTAEDVRRISTEDPNQPHRLAVRLFQQIPAERRQSAAHVRTVGGERV